MKLHMAAAAALVVLMPHASQAGQGCTCRAFGKDYQQGQMACIRGKLARCGMALNNSSWKIVSDTCPESRRNALPFLAGLPRLPRSSLPSC